MSEGKRCPRCKGKMMSKPLGIETTESGVPSWRISGTEVAVFVCGKCGHIEFYDRKRMSVHAEKLAKETSIRDRIRHEPLSARKSPGSERPRRRLRTPLTVSEEERLQAIQAKMNKGKANEITIDDIEFYLRYIGERKKRGLPEASK